MRRIVRQSLVVVAIAAATGCSQPSAPVKSSAVVPAAQAADTIYAGGDIVTVNDSQPTAEAVAVKDGKIVAVGTRADVEKGHKGADTKLVDLAGRTLVPGLIDGHSHVAAFGSQAVGANLLAPPDGTVNTIDDLVAKLQEFAKGPDVGRTGWIFGLGYDDALLGRHPTAEDLDQVSTEIPVIAVHISGHFSAMNSAGLKKVGYTAASKDPEGGIIRRKAGSKEPNGVLEELASIPVAVVAINASKPDDKDYFLRKGMELAKRYGYTTVNEGRAFGFQHKDLADAAARGLFDIDVQAYVDYSDRKEIAAAFSPTYKNHYRVAGLKITLDGSPQGRTAWRTVPYLVPPDGQKKGYKGYPAIPDTKVVEGLFEEAYQNKWPTKVHANGDAAIDQMIAAIKPVHAKHGPGDRRHVLIHGQFVRKDQLEALKALQVIPSLFPMHTFYWGDWYDKIIGPELAQTDLADAHRHQSRHAADDSHRCAGGAAQPDAGDVGHGEPRLAQRQGHGAGRADLADRGTEGHHVVGGLPALRGEDEGLHRGGQAGRLRHPRPEPDHHRPDDHQQGRRARDDQGREDGVREEVTARASTLGPSRSPAPSWRRRRTRRAPLAVLMQTRPTVSASS